jgi:hypothetical protein
MSAGSGSATRHTALAAGEARYLEACAAEAQLWLGEELTAYLAGASSPAELASWTSANGGPAGDGAAAASAAAHRLRVATEVVELFDAAGHGSDARAWLREVAAGPPRRGPAQQIRDARTEQDLHDVRTAAARHLHRA